MPLCTFLLTRIQLRSVQCVTSVGNGSRNLQSASQSVAVSDVTFLASQGNQYTCDDLAWQQGVSLSWGYHSSMPVAATTCRNTVRVYSHWYKLGPSGSMTPCCLVITCRRCGGTIRLSLVLWRKKKKLLAKRLFSPTRRNDVSSHA